MPNVGDAVSRTGRKERLVAHRGSPLKFPENTLPGIEAAVQSGTRWFEIDVQFTSDFVPVVYHDDTLLRVSGDPASILKTPLSRLRELSAGYAERFGNTYTAVPISTLDELWVRMTDWPAVQVFVEIKHHPLDHFGRERVVDRILQSIVDRNRWASVAAIISKDHAAIDYARRQSKMDIGWVVPAWSNDNQRIAERLQPDYLFIKSSRLPESPDQFWAGSWKWVVYTIIETDEAEAWFDRGVDMVETDAIDVMADHFC